MVNSNLASKLSFLGKFGCGCGEPFIVKKYIQQHPEYEKWGRILEDRPNRKWLNINFGELVK